MFLFNKNNPVPHSRTSSLDSPVTDPSVSTPTSEAGVSQCSDASSYGDMPSPEQQERPYPGKRSSVFNLRSRSSTATSTASSLMAMSPAMGRPSSSQRASQQDFRNLAGQSTSELSAGKRSLFNRGNRRKRLSGHFSSAQDLEEVEEGDSVSKRSSVLRKSRRGVNQSEGSLQHLKNRISSPFDFQHLTHTDRHQFAALEQSSENELVAEFSAVRASQAPRRNLTGIKADDLHFNNFSSENLASPESRSSSAVSFRSPPLSPEPPYESQQLDHQTLSRPLRTSRSEESFSQPGGGGYRAHRHTQSAIAPPRASSRQALAPIDDLPEDASDQNQVVPHSRSRSSVRHSGIWDKLTPLSLPATENKLPTISDETGYVGHALTTPDDSAIHPMTPPFSPDLEDVVEEPERFVSPRPAPTPPLRSPKTPRSPFFESFSLRGNQRTPITRSNSRGSSYSSPKSGSQRTPMIRPISQMSETLGSPSGARRSSIRRSTTVRRKSNTWRVMEESWEDDVDYIYDNALEADCDFDWEQSSEDGAVSEDRDRTPEQSDHLPASPVVSHGTETSSSVSQEHSAANGSFFSGSFRPSLLVPSANSIPELESRSTMSASTADTGIQTPSDFFNPMDHRQAPLNDDEFNPALLVPPEFKDSISREEMYDDILADYAGSDRHFPLLENSQSVSSSSRSSRVRSSKRSSYDSSLMSSSGQGSGSWSSPVRRSASSSGSLPELVHSRHSRRDHNMTVDQLSEQVASFSSLGEDDTEDNEDDDTTPPGRPVQDRTFFSSEDEEQRAKDLRASIEGEVRASLELARRGSTRSSRAPVHYHKYASSDGAAKLLASPMPAAPELQQPPKSRNRAASSSKAVRGNRQPYLSLFPTPPKHSPVPTPTSPVNDPFKNY